MSKINYVCRQSRDSRIQNPSVILCQVWPGRFQRGFWIFLEILFDVKIILKFFVENFQVESLVVKFVFVWIDGEHDDGSGVIFDIQRQSEGLILSS